ncbi:MAG: YfhO family protein [Limisphaerales bacterium]
MTEDTPMLTGLARGIGRVVIIAVFAGFIAAQTIVSLIGSSIVGVAGTGQDAESKAARWDFATQWSEPKKETLGLFVPGLFGYKLDTPKDMAVWLQDFYKGGNYWGGVGRDPAIDRFFDSGQTGSPPPGFMRFTGGGNYCGILVFLVAVWAIAQSFRRQNSVYAEIQRRYIWFCAAILAITLLLSYGRFAPFYKVIYALPYFSTIRNPTKFLIVFSWAIVILFAYGIHGLSRRYLEVPAGNTNSFSAQLKGWWTKVRGFDRNWTTFSAVAVMASILGWLVYSMQKPTLAKYIQTVGFDAGMAKGIAAFSVGQVGWFVLFFGLVVALCILIIAGIFSGKRARLGGILLGILLVVDLARADLPYIIHWDYKQKYDINPANPTDSTNPIINFLRDKPYEHRVAGLPFEAQQQLRLYDNAFGGSGVYRIEWVQHHFPYYNIQCLDLIQMSRMAEDLKVYLDTLSPRSEETAPLIARRWELTNTRYLLGAAGFLDVINQQLDPVQHRFRIVQRFDIVSKPGIIQPTRLEELTAQPSNDGDLALFEFTGALPRAKLYSNWQVNTNDEVNLKTLADLNFDPAKTVLISTPQKDLSAVATNENSGTVEFKSYAPKHIVFTAQAALPSVLLLNDKYDPNWRVTVDGQPAELLRCNFIMRGVYLTPGQHTVEFQFSLPNKPLYITLTAIGVGILLSGFLVVSTRRKS